MNEPRPEVLVIFDADEYEAGIAKLRASVAVTQAMPPRLALLAAPPSWERESLPQGVAFNVDENIPDSLLDGFTQSERVFIQAWKERRHLKRRPGDKLAWDAPGYSPPDRPAS
jgi:hypothetical protein